MKHTVTSSLKGESNVSVDAAVRRGPQSWAFIYIALGFALAIESSLIPMFTPLEFPYNIIVYLMIAVVTFWLFIENGKFQNWLLGKKQSYEDKAR